MFRNVLSNRSAVVASAAVLCGGVGSYKTAHAQGSTSESIHKLSDRCARLERAAGVSSAPSSLKLTYFGLPGRAEMSRLALAAGGIPFEDNRVDGKEWGAMKESVKPWGQLPILEIDGTTTISQSCAILRYCGNLAGFVPADPIAEARSNELIDATEDIIKLFIPSFAIKDPAEKVAARVEICKDGGKLEETLAKFEAFVTTYGNDGFSVGSSLTVGDFALYNWTCMLVSGWLDGVPLTVLNKFPALQKHRQTIGSLPAVKAFYANETEGIRAVGWKLD